MTALHIEAILRNDMGYYDWFSAHVIRLVAKADAVNRERIRVAFPEHVAAYEAWYYKPAEGRFDGYEGAEVHYDNAKDKLL